MSRFRSYAVLGIVGLMAVGGPLLAGRGGGGRGGGGGWGGGRSYNRSSGGWSGPSYPTPSYAPPSYAPANPPPASEPAEDQTPCQNQRYLKVRNDTGQKLTVSVRYRTMDRDGDWVWLPGDGDAMTYTLSAGAERYLPVGSEKLCASRVRIWAETADGQQMEEYREKDLWLVPEKDKKGEHWYEGRKMEDFTFTFSVGE